MQSTVISPDIQQTKIRKPVKKKLKKPYVAPKLTFLSKWNTQHLVGAKR